MRAALIVDGDNIGLQLLKSFDGARLNYPELYRALSKSYDLVHASVYLRKTNGNEGFVAMLKKSGYLVRQREKKTNVDTFLLWDALKLIPKVDAFFLAACDSDYLPILWDCRTHGVRGVIIGVKGATARDLEENADEVLYLSEEWLFKPQPEEANGLVMRVGL
jgi:uncharacterized LabA/DUF88 family protein